MFYRIIDVKPLSDMRLLVRFSDDTLKSYDVEPLVKKYPSFHDLASPPFFKQVRVDTGGYGVVWNDELDISCNELWNNGQPI